MSTKNDSTKLYNYDVAFSFAGEQRKYVKKVRDYIHSKGIKVFYDEAQVVDMWGQNLIEYFQDIFKNNARYCVMFISREYAKKVWPNFENEVIQARSLVDNHYILPVRFDDVEIKGLLETTAHITVGKHKPEELGELIYNKIQLNLGKNRREPLLFSQWIQNDTFYHHSILNNSKKIQKDAETRVLHLFHEAAVRIPAYKHFLQKNNVDHTRVKTITDFATVPPTTKTNYINLYTLPERCWDGNLNKMHTISKSSGSHGKSLLWPRDLSTEIEGAYLYEFILKNFYQIHTKKTLFINTFAMGVWTAGAFTSACMNLLAWKDYPITTINTSVSIQDTFRLLKQAASDFDQIIITGYTPFLKDLLDQGIQTYSIDWSKMNIKLLCSSENLSENHRTYLLKLLNKSNYYDSVMNTYASAEASLMAFETPFSILLNKLLHSSIEKSPQRAASLYTFDPRLIFIEEINGKLHISKHSGAPLLRYDIQDEGEVISYEETVGSISEQNPDLLKKANDLGIKQYMYQFPFIYFYTTPLFSINFYGIYFLPEWIKEALSKEPFSRYVTGRFILHFGQKSKYSQSFEVQLELKQSYHGISKTIHSQLKTSLVQSLCGSSPEYKALYNDLKDKVTPKLTFWPHEDPRYFEKKLKLKWINPVYERN